MGADFGKLYLIPTTLGMNEPLEVLPISVKNALCSKCIPLFVYEIRSRFENKRPFKVIWPIIGYIKLWVFTDLLALLLISLASYLFFGVHVNILYLSILVISLEYIVRVIYSDYLNSTALAQITDT